MKQENLRQRLIDGTIHVIARDGLDKATTKQIGTETSTNEGYIYRCFGSKEDLLVNMFDALDEELLNEAMCYIDVMYTQELAYELRCRLYFSAMWSFLLGNREKCLAFMQYYYSPYFQKYSVEVRKQRYEPLIGKFKGAFADEADVWMILNHILNVMLDFAVKVHNAEMPGTDNYTEHVFRVIYQSVKQYFRNNKESDS